MALNAVVGALRVNLGMNSAAFSKGADQAQRRLRQMQRQIADIGARAQRVGAGLSVGLTLPIIALATKSVDASAKQEKAIAAVDAALASMGQTAGFTSAQLQDMASSLQGSSTFGDEEILSRVTANLLTFGNVAGDVFERAQQAALDLSARLGQDLQSSAIQLGKALNDPVKGITALSRVGVSFTEQQKEQIEAMAEAGRVADAQRLILAELEKQYAGQAAALAATDAGKLTQSLNRLGDASERIGAIVLPVIAAIAERAADLADRFATLDPQTQKIAVAVAGFAAALGPLTIALGVTVSAFAALLPVIAAVAVPFAIIAATVGTVAAGFYLLRSRSNELETPAYNVAAAVAAINGELDQFSRETAPASGQAAIALANDYVRLSEEALNAAEAQLAAKRAELEAVRQNPNIAGRNERGRELALNRQIEGSLRDLAAAEEALARARANQVSTQERVIGSTYGVAEATEGARKEIELVIKGLDEIGGAGGSGGSAARAASALDDLARANDDLADGLAQTGDLLGDVFEGFGTGGIAGGFDVIKRSANDAFGSILSGAFSRGGGGFGAVLGDLSFKLSSLGSQIVSVFRGGGLSAIGSALGSALPLLGAVGFVAPLLKGLIGGTKVTGQGFDLGFQGGELVGGQFVNKKTKRLFGLISSSSSKVNPFGAELRAALEEQADGIVAAVSAVYSELGVNIGDAAIGGIDLAVTRFDTRGLSEEEIAERFGEIFARYGDAISDAVGGVAFELAAGLAAVTRIIEPVGQSFFGSISAMADAAADLAGRAGGFDALASQASFFFDNFFTQAEQFASIQSSVSDAFGSLNLAVPKTIAQFKELVLSQNLMTEAGRETYAALLQVAPQFREIADGVSGSFGAFDFSTKRFETDLQERIAQVAIARNYDAEQLRRFGVFETDLDGPGRQLSLLSDIKDVLDDIFTAGIPERV